MPVDSEHSALAQCLRGGSADEVRRLVLTASGGPFRGRTAAQLAGVTVEEALAHPTWDMGPVVTINSATLVNKGLEVIEAHLLFGIPFDRIEVVVHPTSRRALDGRVRRRLHARAGQPADHAHPDRAGAGLAGPASPTPRRPSTGRRAETWEFFPLDDEAFPAVSLARQAGEAGGTAPAVYNAANEVAVAAFRDGRLPFSRIVPTIADVLVRHDVPSGEQLTVDDVLAADAWARREAARLVGTEDPRDST